MFDSYDPFEVALPDVVIRGRRTRGPADGLGGVGIQGCLPLVLLHGHPQTHLMWHRIADELARDVAVVAPDLRGYGASSRPAGGPDHAAYAKRVMAGDVLAVMDALGVERFGVVGHDRGGRVAARLAADHPERVSAVLLLDIVPTEAMYVATSRELAESYWHWFFLTQPAPMPERLIEGDPRAYVQGVIGSRYAGLEPFPTAILDHYVDALTGPGAARGICEDYRAAATIDVSHDAADRAAGRLIEPELHVIWGEHGPVGRLFDPLAEWKQVARTVTGAALDCGHYLAEERPNETLAAIRRWMSQPN